MTKLEIVVYYIIPTILIFTIIGIIINLIYTYKKQNGNGNKKDIFHLTTTEYGEMCLFMSFLKDNGIKEKFIYNITKNKQFKYFQKNVTHKTNKKYIFLNLRRYSKPIFFISDMGIWKETNEGWEYWKNINNIWVKHYISWKKNLYI